MKKLVCALLALCLLPVIAFADFDLSAMSVDELAALNKAVVMELMSREDFKEVPVPPGEYTIGEDIPEGTYSVKVANDDYAMIEIYKNGTLNDAYTVLAGTPVGKIVLVKGQTISISFFSVIFMPYAGLGF